MKEQVESKLINSGGRFVGIRTNDGRTFNAKVLRVTPFYVTIYDNNNRVPVKLAKTSIASVS